jgi:hypothetical protein
METLAGQSHPALTQARRHRDSRITAERHRLYYPSRARRACPSGDRARRADRPFFRCRLLVEHSYEQLSCAVASSETLRSSSLSRALAANRYTPLPALLPRKDWLQGRNSSYAAIIATAGGLTRIHPAFRVSGSEHGLSSDETGPVVPGMAAQTASANQCSMPACWDWLMKTLLPCNPPGNRLPVTPVLVIVVSNFPCEAKADDVAIPGI